MARNERDQRGLAGAAWRRRARSRVGAALLVLLAAARTAGAQVASDPLWALSAPAPTSNASVRAALSATGTGTAAPPRAGDALDLRREITTTPSARDASKRPPAQRRSRQPTARQTQAAMRQQVPPRLFPVVQNPVAGLPDIGDAPLLRRRRLDADDPYAPVGIRVGNVVYFPSVGQSVGYDTNPDRISPGRRPSAALRSEGALAFRSDWSAHQLEGELRGGYFDYPDNKSANRPDGQGAVRLRLDVDRDTKIDTEAHYTLDTQRAGSPDLSASVQSRPLVLSYGGSVGVTENFNRFQVRLSGLVDRQQYENATLTDGTLLRQDDRNANQYGLRLRTGYELTPGLMPFVDTLIDTRVHDLAVDFAGYRRDSDGIGFTVGSTFEVSRMLTGEVSGGLLRRTYVDRRLRDLDGPVVNAAIVWAATPLTTVRFGATTSVTETDLPGASGILTQRGTVEVTHDLRRNLRLVLAGSLYTNDYQGVRITEKGATASVGLEYRLTRWLALRGTYAHETLKSTFPGSSYSANTYLVGLRVNP